MPTTDFSVAERIGAIQEGINTIQQNYEQVNNTSFDGNFPSVVSMNEGLTLLKQGFSSWPATKIDLEHAVQSALDLKDKLNALESSTMDETIIPKLHAFRSGPLVTTQSAWDTAVAQFAVFSDQLIRANTDSQVKINQAHTDVQNDETKFQSDLESLKSEIDDLDSAGSIALGIFSAGIYSIVKLKEAKDDYSRVTEERDQLIEEYSRYNYALSAYTSASNCAMDVVHKMNGFQASVQQVQNALNDLPSIDSSNMVVIKAVLQAIQSDYN